MKFITDRRHTCSLTETWHTIKSTGLLKMTTPDTSVKSILINGAKIIEPGLIAEQLRNYFDMCTPD